MGPRGSMGLGWEAGPGWKDVRFGATLVAAADAAAQGMHRGCTDAGFVRV
jgi:hypothetical protein